MNINLDKSPHTEENLKLLFQMVKALLVVFAYLYWLVIVAYFGVMAETTSLHIKILSIPLTVVSLALARVFHEALKEQAYGFATLFFIGLLVSGALA